MSIQAVTDTSCKALLSRAALVVVVLATGCADYEGDSKAGFLAEANAICESSGATVMPALEELQGDGIPTTGELRGFAGDVAAPALQKRVDELRQLNPPTEDRASVDDIIRATQRGIDQITADATQLVDGDPFFDANVDARVYGLTSCVLGAEP